MQLQTKHIFILAVTLFVSQNYLWGQTKHLNLIRQNNLLQAEKTISKDLSDKYNDVALNYAMSMLYIAPKYKRYNLEKSYLYLTRSSKFYKQTNKAHVLKSLNKIPINQQVFDNYTDTIGRLAMKEALKTNTIARYSKFIEYYKTAPKVYLQRATQLRDSLAFQLVLASNTLEAYQSFIGRYTKAAQYQKAVDIRDSIAFEKAIKADSIVVYKAFITNYPKAKQVNAAWSGVYKLAYAAAKKVNTSESYRKFAEEYPASSQYAIAYKIYEEKQFLDNTTRGGGWLRYKAFCEKYPNNPWNSVALDSIYIFANKTKDFDAMQFCVDKMTGSKRDALLFVLHQLFTSDGEKLTLDLFYKKNKDELLNEVKSKDYEMVELSHKLKLHLPYYPKDEPKYDAYIRMAAPRAKAFVALQKMISANLTHKDWKTAMLTTKKYASYFGNKNTEIDNLLYLLSKKTDKSIKINAVGNAINTATGGEYAPVIAANDKSLYFCGRDRKDNIGGEDIFVSQRQNGVWQSAEIVKTLSMKKSNDAPLSVSADGTMILLFKSGKILHADKLVNGWTEAIPFPKNINAASWQADAMISSNGKALLFASTKKGGYNLFSENSATETYHGGNQYFSDIYVSLLNKSNKWSEPINLGNVINTRFCDRMPFLHPDMKTLYFSSDGHGGLGELDVYKSTRLADSCWNCWSEPVNLGKEINTESSDWGYKISTDGQTAYFAKNNAVEQNFDVFYLNLPTELRPNPVVTISGKILDKNNQPVSVEIRWKDLETGEDVGQSKNDPANGNFFIVLPVGKNYRYSIDKEKYYPFADDIDLRKQKKTINIEKNIKLLAYNKQLAMMAQLPFNNFLFNIASSTLLVQAKLELKQVAKVIIANQLKIEVIGHTDIKGDAIINQTLSVRRATAVREFLMKEGCTPKQLIMCGFGKTQPIANNDAAVGRAKNRRVELRVVSSW